MTCGIGGGEADDRSLMQSLKAGQFSIRLWIIVRGCSSVGRAPVLQAGGRRFDPDQLHQFYKRA